MAAIDDDDRPKKKIAHEVGQDLSLLSVETFRRVQLLHDEIGRIEADIAQSAPNRGRRSVFQEIMAVCNDRLRTTVKVLM